MELVLKLPKDKPPFMGILFDNSYKAATLNQNFVNDLQNRQFNMVITPAGLTLRLICENPYSSYDYTELTCDMEKFKHWLVQPRPLGYFNFSHIMRKYDKDEVVRTLKDRKLFVLQIWNLEIRD